MTGKIFVESLDETYRHGFGILIYKIIADHIMSDLAIGKAIQQMRILIDIKKPIFAVSVRFGPSIPPIQMKDYAHLEERADGVHIVIHDETYASDLLRVLWENFGRENITQIDRWETVVPRNLTTLEELQNMVIADPGEKMKERILDVVTRIIPEGFRIGSISPEANGITVIASENPIQREWTEMVKVALAKPPKPLPPEKLERVERKPRPYEGPMLEEFHIPWGGVEA